MEDIILIKLGGSLITDKKKPYTVRKHLLRRICKEIHEARSKTNIKLVVAHGGGSFPHVSAKRYQTHLGFVHEKSIEGFARVQRDAAKLNRIVVDELILSGENAVSVQPSASCIASNGRIIKWFLKPLMSMLENNMIPVPYGDVCFDVKLGCSIVSTEEILRYLSKVIKPSSVIMVTDVDGVLDEKGRTISHIKKKDVNLVSKYLSGSLGFADVTGGMLHKVKLSLEIAKYTKRVLIINGLKKDYLKSTILGKNVKATKITCQ